MSLDENAWARGEVDHFEAVANFNFQGEGAEELSFSAGQTLKVAPKGKTFKVMIILCHSSFDI